MRTTLFFVLTATVLFAGGCGGGTRGGWCGRIERHHPAFDTDRPLDKQALAEFDKIADEAPAELRGDLRAVHDGVVAFYDSDPQFRSNPQRVQQFVDAIERVDDYLRRECEADIPRRGRS